MKHTALIFVTTGFEEIEMLTVVDVLRRGDVDIKIVSLAENIKVTGAHDIEIIADSMFSDEVEADFLILPGGGVLEAYMQHEKLQELLVKQNNSNKWIAAICAAPCLLGHMGLLKGKRAVCYPDLEEYLTDAIVTEQIVEEDGNIITSKAPATAMMFAFRILEKVDKNKAKEVKNDMYISLVYPNRLP